MPRLWYQALALMVVCTLGVSGEQAPPQKKGTSRKAAVRPTSREDTRTPEDLAKELAEALGLSQEEQAKVMPVLVGHKKKVAEAREQARERYKDEVRELEEEIKDAREAKDFRKLPELYARRRELSQKAEEAVEAGIKERDAEIEGLLPPEKKAKFRLWQEREQWASRFRGAYMLRFYLGRLKLTPEQKTKVDALVKAHAEDLRLLSVRMADFSARRKAEHKLYAGLQEVLTPEQRQKLVETARPGKGMGATARIRQTAPAKRADEIEAESLAPFVPTPPEVVEAMLKLADVKPTDVVYDLGCGDGRIVIMAAEKFGAKGVGVELDAELYRKASRRVRELGLEDKVTIIRGDLLKVDLSPATVVTLYLLTDSNRKLRPKLEASLGPGARVVSHDFQMPGWEHVKMEEMKSKTGMPHTIYLFHPPQKKIPQ